MIATLDERLWFPDPTSAGQFEDSLGGLIAVGGDLSVPRLLLAYRSGIFPWTEDPITWWSPNPRAILDFDRLHVGRSLRRVLSQDRFRITRNQDFPGVIAACAAPYPGRDSTWITPGFQRAYTRLHHAGHAHSIECWQDQDLVGGIYGVAIGGFFAGESMFHRVDNTSKVALVHLVAHLRKRGFVLFDVQMLTPLTQAMGASVLPRADYLNRLRGAVGVAASFL
jgi:leucyl/phenylalanyl-tRNA--protein transferase